MVLPPIAVTPIVKVILSISRLAVFVVVALTIVLLFVSVYTL